MSIAVIINEEDFSSWTMTYPSFILFLSFLQNQYTSVDIYIPFKCEDTNFIQSLKNFNVKVNEQVPSENEYTFIINWYNSIILSQYNFVDIQYFSSVNYIVSRKYNSHPNFYYCNSEIYFSENKDYFIKNNLIVDYIYTKSI
jgi:hypothetical protein